MEGEGDCRELVAQSWTPTEHGDVLSALEGPHAPEACGVVAPRHAATSLRADQADTLTCCSPAAADLTQQRPGLALPVDEPAGFSGRVVSHAGGASPQHRPDSSPAVARTETLSPRLRRPDGTAQPDGSGINSNKGGASPSTRRSAATKAPLAAAGALRGVAAAKKAGGGTSAAPAASVAKPYVLQPWEDPRKLLAESLPVLNEVEGLIKVSLGMRPNSHLAILSHDPSSLSNVPRPLLDALQETMRVVAACKQAIDAQQQQQAPSQLKPRQHAPAGGAARQQLPSFYADGSGGDDAELEDLACYGDGDGDGGDDDDGAIDDEDWASAVSVDDSAAGHDLGSPRTRKPAAAAAYSNRLKPRPGSASAKRSEAWSPVLRSGLTPRKPPAAVGSSPLSAATPPNPRLPTGSFPRSGGAAAIAVVASAATLDDTSYVCPRLTTLHTSAASRSSPRAPAAGATRPEGGAQQRYYSSPEDRRLLVALCLDKEATESAAACAPRLSSACMSSSCHQGGGAAQQQQQRWQETATLRGSSLAACSQRAAPSSAWPSPGACGAAGSSNSNSVAARLRQCQRQVEEDAAFVEQLHARQHDAVQKHEGAMAAARQQQAALQSARSQAEAEAKWLAYRERLLARK